MTSFKMKDLMISIESEPAGKNNFAGHHSYNNCNSPSCHSPSCSGNASCRPSNTCTQRGDKPGLHNKMELNELKMILSNMQAKKEGYGKALVA